MAQPNSNSKSPTPSSSSTTPYICNFCPKAFKSCKALSGHYNKHKNLDHDEWVRNGPKGSKILKGILQARAEGKTYHYKKRTWTSRAERALAIEPLRAIPPPGPPPRVTGHVVRIQGRQGLLVVRNRLADEILGKLNTARFGEVGPEVKIQGPDGLLIRRDFVALSEGVTKMGPVGRAPEPGVGSSANAGSDDVGPPPGFGFPNSAFPTSSRVARVKPEIIVIDD